MRVVLDANVLVSALLTPGGEAETIRRQVEDRFTLAALHNLAIIDNDCHLSYPVFRTPRGAML